MKKFRLTLLLAWGASAVFAAPRQVIVITLDGYPAYALRDPLYPAPALRRMIQEGAWAPEGMTPVNPAVTWPNHTSLLTGVDPAHHGVIYNGLPVRENGAVRIQWDVPKKELVLAKTVYDLAREKGMKTAEVDWPATDRAGIDFEFAEIPSAGSLVVKEMVKAGGLDDAGIENFRKQPIAYRDEIWTRAAIEIVRNHHPNLLLFHLLTTDSVQHRYGARSLAASAALALADRQVARLVEAVRESGAAAQTTFIVVSDHGFATAKRQIRPAAPEGTRRSERRGGFRGWKRHTLRRRARRSVSGRGGNCPGNHAGRIRRAGVSGAGGPNGESRSGRGRRIRLLGKCGGAGGGRSPA